MSKLLYQDLDYIFNKTNHLVQDLNGKTIFITGGTGFIGKWLLEYFLFLNKQKSIHCNIIVLSRNPVVFQEKFSRFNLSFIRFIEGNVVEFDSTSLPYCDIIIHAATDSDALLNSQEPLKMIETIVEGTKKVLNYGVQVQTKKVLFLSSGAIYGIQPDNITGFPENYSGGPDLLNASSAYSEAKRLAELLCVCYNKQYQMNVSIARCFAFVGPYLPLNKHYAIGNFIGNGLRNEDIIIKGNGLPLRSYMYAADLIIWLFHILLKGQSGEAYNVGSDFAVSLKEIANIVAQFFPNLAVKILGQVNLTDRNQNYIPSIIKMRSELNAPDFLTLNESIKRTIKYHLDNEQL
jgi:dTDP-glucose 4,6-dehydratase